MAPNEAVGDALRRADWRCRAVSVLAQDIPAAGPGTSFHTKGELVTLATAVKIQGQLVWFHMPGAGALFLDQAIKAREEWRAAQTVVMGQAGHPDQVSRLAFDALEAAMTMVVA